MKNTALDATALTLSIIGAVNWGLIGLFKFDLVAVEKGDRLIKADQPPVYSSDNG